MSSEASLRIREIVRKRAGFVLDPAKDYLLEARLQPILATFCLDSLAELVARIDGGSARLLRAAIDALIVGETSFFRDTALFDALREVVLPPLVERRAAARKLTIWSAVASTGQEPYSIAILLREHFPKLRSWETLVLATDLSIDSLRKAGSGRYSQLELNRGVAPRLLARHFRRDGIEWLVHPEVRRLVEFRRLNLAKREWPELPRADVVFLRGALKYFDPRRRSEILRRVRSVLAPDGFLFLGQDDAPTGPTEGFEPIEVGGARFYHPIHSGEVDPPPATPAQRRRASVEAPPDSTQAD